MNDCSLTVHGRPVQSHSIVVLLTFLVAMGAVLYIVAVEQHPWPLPTRGQQQHPLPQL